MDRREHHNDLTEAVRTSLDGRQAEIWTALPGIINSFDPDAMTVSVQPAIKGTTTAPNGTDVSVALPLLVDVPIQFPQGGGFCLTFPIVAGDECLVVFASRCIDGWWQSGGIQPPAEHRMHDLSDGFALIGVRSQARKLDPAINTSDVQLRSDDGNNYVAITPDGVMTHKAKTEIILDAPKISMLAPIILLDSETITMIGAWSAIGPAGADTTATIQGKLTATDDVVSGSISGKSHKHAGVQAGPDITGVPI